MALHKRFIRVLLRQNRFVSIVPAVVSHQKHRRHNGNENNFNQWKPLYPVVFGSVLIGTVLAENAKDDNSSEKTSFEAGEKRPDLPIFKAEEVSKHNNKDSFWVTYRHGVYDVTSFLPSHPGGEQIYNAAGYSIEPFWNVYGMHKTEEVYRLLESYRIGNLHVDDIVDHSDDELWAREPARRRELLVKTAKPFNAEVPPSTQVDHFDTPNDLFYVRQHMPVPEIDASRHKVKVTVKTSSKVTVKEFTLDDLKRFEPVTIRAALMCAGNRRSEMNKVKPVKGLSWGGGAISNAVWTGYRLRDVLYACGVNGDNMEGQHVVFTGADIDATGTNFSTSIPLHMALNPNLDILLAYEMNGKPLPPDHGYPMRMVVPGAPAVRSVKWLESITVSEDESASHWHQKDYRSFNPSKDWDTADFATAPPVYSLPVTSAICDPLDGDTVKVIEGRVVVRGYAYSGGGAKVLRVDLSADQGATWIETDISASDAAPPGRHYSWLLWTARVPVTQNMKEVELWVKATDSNFNTQPENFRDIWNIRGILSNAYHKIKVKLIH